MKKLNPTQRLVFANIFIMNMLGIGLTGFGQVHWFSYVLPISLLFSVASGYCLGYDVSRKITSRFETPQRSL